jgi:glyceraldehyde-3-phosphate dehydrogenase/erythrose-4-phosphate dehydrogenase
MQDSYSFEVVQDVFAQFAKKNPLFAITNNKNVSTDYISNKNIVVVDNTLSKVYANNLKIVAWFDNEMGYVSNLKQLLVQFNNVTYNKFFQK